MKKLLFTLAVLWAMGAAAYMYWSEHQDRHIDFRTVPVTRGDLSLAITTTGTLEPVEVMDVGPQIPGQVKSFGPDLDDPSKSIDFGSRVEEGTVLAQLEDLLYQAKVEQANAGLVRARAEIQLARVKMQQAERDFLREQNLRSKGASTPQVFEQAMAEFEAAKATLALNESALTISEANLQEAKVNLEYTTLRSPARGVVIDRRVNLGQSVVANVNATSLFLIAANLDRLEIWASVNESDVGSIYPGQEVRFTVSALPGEEFRGTVSQIRLNASMIQNVVTYTCVVDVDNDDHRLLPYLTARVQFLVDSREDSLLVPNAALRWRPGPELLEPPDPTGLDPLKVVDSPGTDGEDTPTVPEVEADDRAGDEGRGVVWVRRGKYVAPVHVGLGLTDGVLTAITSEELTEGTDVIVGELRPGETSDSGDDGDKTNNPFLPQLKKGNKSKE